MIPSSTRQAELTRLALDVAASSALDGAREEALLVFRGHPNAETEDGRRTLEDAARQHFLGAALLATNSDPAHPDVLAVFMYEHELESGEVVHSALHGGLENPDNVYRIIPVSHEWSYEISGVQHENAPAQVTYELVDSAPGVEGLPRQLGLLTNHDLEVADDGTFTITVDASPANGRRNHLQCPPEAKALFVRDTLTDWHRQVPNLLRVRRVAGPERPRRTREQIETEAAALVPRFAQFWMGFRDEFLEKMNPKTNAFESPEPRTGAWGYITNSRFSLAPDEALVFTTEVGEAPYHAVMIGNDWWIAHEASRRSGSFTAAQATPNPDGSFTFVIAQKDPGVVNWIDTGGVSSGIVQVRWQGAAPGATPPSDVRDARVVRISELAGELPEVSRQERDNELTERHRDYRQRLRYL